MLLEGDYPLVAQVDVDAVLRAAADVAPLAKALLAANLDRIVWGTDWPHPRPEGPVPDAKHLLDLFCDWTGEPARSAILSANPVRLYEFAPS